MKFIMGKKIEMTQVWKEDRVVAVTKVQAGPCTIVQVKNKEKDGYSAVQVGFGDKKEKNINKAQLGHMKDLGNFRYLREFRFENDELVGELKKGDMIDTATFEAGDEIKVSGVSKGKGFQGVVKRHGFKGQSATHGTKDQERMPGSAGATGPAHVFKGMRMPGRMGGDNVTVANLEVVDVDNENNIIFIKGAVPGHRNSLILIKANGELKLAEPAKEVEALMAEENTENTVPEVKNKEEVKEEKSAQSSEGAGDESLTRDSKEEVKAQKTEEKVPEAKVEKEEKKEESFIEEK